MRSRRRFAAILLADLYEVPVRIEGQITRRRRSGKIDAYLPTPCPACGERHRYQYSGDAEDMFYPRQPHCYPQRPAGEHSLWLTGKRLAHREVRDIDRFNAAVRKRREREARQAVKARAR